MPKKILLADDSITIQKVVELTFSDGDYEVTAVNNGAKAIQKLSEMRPDIILSDIIMPDKNGYEVCEFVKSHPDYRTIPVILLTGTFEPFDPDRADKAGCDAVVTKPFESQSLIQKVEELLASASSGSSSPAPNSPAPSFETEQESPFAGLGGGEPFAHGGDIFDSTAVTPPASPEDMPLETPAPAFGGETRAFPRMNFDELQKMAAQPPAAAPAAAEPPAAAADASPWEEQAPAFSGETRAFPRMSFEELQKMNAPDTPPPAAPAAPASPAPESPFGDAAAAGGETRAFPRMSFDDLEKMADQPAASSPPPAAASNTPFGDPEAPAFGGETRAFPRMSFDDLQKMATPDVTPEPSAPAATAPTPGPGDASPWEETPAASTGETPMFGSMADDSTKEPVPAAAADNASPWAEEAAAPSAPVGVAGPEHDAHHEPRAETTPVSFQQLAAKASSEVLGGSGEMTDDQVDRIARRVVQMMSQDVVRNIAWEIIPDMAEMVVKERIRQLESEG